MTETHTGAGRYTPVITIAIPTFERAAYLNEAVTSALTQHYPTIEVLISDDGSKPGVSAVGKAASAEDSRVRYWRNERTLGLAGNWNRCVDEARGEYILIIGDDDRIIPEGISALVSNIDEMDDVLFGNHYVIDHLGKRLLDETMRYSEIYRRDKLKAGKILNAEPVVWKNSIPICASLIRTAVARKIRFNEELNTPEIVLFAEMANAGANFKYVPAFVSEYRVHTASATTLGLWNDALARRLLEIDVQAETEVHKRNLLGPLLTAAVATSLLKGEVRKARSFIDNHYFPNKRQMTPHALALKACMYLPGNWPAPVYGTLRKVKELTSNGAHIRPRLPS